MLNAYFMFHEQPNVHILYDPVVGGGPCSCLLVSGFGLYKVPCPLSGLPSSIVILNSALGTWHVYVCIYMGIGVYTYT